MASILRKGEKWRALIFKAGVRISKVFDRRDEAVKWATDRESEINGGKRIAGAHTLKEALEAYRDGESPKKRGKRWEVTRLNAFIRDLKILDKPITGVTTADLAKWRDGRLAEVSSGTVLREINLLSSVFEIARKEWKWILINPMKDVGRPAKPQHRERLITDEERDKMVEILGAKGKQREVALGFLLSLETAMRAGEVFELDWERIYLQQRYLSLKKTKNGTSRDVPLSTAAVKLLESTPDRSGRVFRVTTASADTLFRKARKRAGLSGFVYHDTRHTACTRLAKRLHVLDLAKMIGHKNLKSLMIYYNESATEIAKRLD